MSSTTATTSAPKPVENTAKPAQGQARAPKDKTDGEDMFASLLSLLASTQVLPEAATLTRAVPDEPTTRDTTPPDRAENPFAALLGWGLPGTGKDTTGQPASTGGAGIPGAVGSADRAVEGKIDITGMTPVEPAPLDTAAKGQVALPANAVRPGAPQAPTRAAEGPTTVNPGPHWRQAGTETVFIQQAVNQASQVRSTVALNERFGLTPGVSLASTDTRESSNEGLSLDATAGVGSRTADATTPVSGTTAGDTATGSDHTGSEPSAFEQNDGQNSNPLADAQAGDEPTVTHWGTQHLRHASLRVDGEGGEQAIDIQLSMKGQEVQVAFNTDNAEARASLREHAGESLGDLLNKSGIQLGGVSVGAQGQPGSRGDEGAARHSGVRGVASAAREALAPAHRPVQTAPRADGSQPLDVFA